jgi:ribosomal-protein-alanine N-acetyltransferase
MNTTEESRRLYLKVLTEADAELVLDFYLRNRDFFEPWETDKVPNFYTLDYQRAVLVDEMNQFIHRKYLRFYLFLKDHPDTIIGSVCFSNIHYGIYQNCLLGYKIDNACTRQHYACESIAKSLDLLFHDWKLHRVEVLISPKNTPSLMLSRKLGFYPEGISYSCVRIDGQWQDCQRLVMINPYE